jgi:hypothetical protein
MEIQDGNRKNQKQRYILKNKTNNLKQKKMLHINKQRDQINISYSLINIHFYYIK